MIVEQKDISVIEKAIISNGFKIIRKQKNYGIYSIDFMHSNIEDTIDNRFVFESSVSYNPNTKQLNTTVYNELGHWMNFDLSYCCEIKDNVCEFKCRPHADVTVGRVAIEAEFSDDNSIDRFKSLLKEIKHTHEWL